MAGISDELRADLRKFFEDGMKRIDEIISGFGKKNLKVSEIGSSNDQVHEIEESLDDGEANDLLESGCFDETPNLDEEIKEVDKIGNQEVGAVETDSDDAEQDSIIEIKELKNNNDEEVITQIGKLENPQTFTYHTKLKCHEYSYEKNYDPDGISKLLMLKDDFLLNTFVRNLNHISSKPLSLFFPKPIAHALHLTTQMESFIFNLPLPFIPYKDPLIAPPLSTTPKTPILSYSELTHYSTSSNLSEAKIFHVTLIVIDFFSYNNDDKVLRSQLVNVYVLLGCLQDALLVFDKFPQKSNIAWAGVLKALLDAPTGHNLGKLRVSSKSGYGGSRQELFLENITMSKGMRYNNAPNSSLSRLNESSDLVDIDREVEDDAWGLIILSRGFLNVGCSSKAIEFYIHLRVSQGLSNFLEFLGKHAFILEDKALEFNDYFHNHQPPISFIKTKVRGLFGTVFCDFDPEFTFREGTTNFGGFVTQVKQPKVLNFNPSREALKGPGDFLLSDFLKFDHPLLLHIAFLAPDKFISEFGGFPVAGSNEDAQKLTSIATHINECLEEEQMKDINPKLLRHLVFGARVVLNSMAAMFGGIVRPEIVKACSIKFHHLFQLFYFDSVESLSAEPLDPSDFQPLNGHYDAQISVFGSKLQKKLSVAKVKAYLFDQPSKFHFYDFLKPLFTFQFPPPTKIEQCLIVECIEHEDKAKEKGDGSIFGVTSLPWHGGSVYVAWSSCSSNQTFYGVLGSWSAYLISVLYIEYGSRKEKENVSFKNHVILWFAVLADLLEHHWKAAGLVFSGIFLLIGYFIQLIICASNIYYINDKLDKKTWTFIFGAGCASTMFIPSFHSYRLWSFLDRRMIKRGNYAVTEV